VVADAVRFEPVSLAIFKMQGDSAEMQGGAPRKVWTKSNIYNGMQDCLPTQGAGRPFIASRDIQGEGVKNLRIRG